MFFVYILELTNSSWYIRYSENIHQRLSDHNDGLVSSTRRKRPLSLIYYEAYLNKYDALGREKFLKNYLSNKLR